MGNAGHIVLGMEVQEGIAALTMFVFAFADIAFMHALTDWVLEDFEIIKK